MAITDNYQQVHYACSYSSEPLREVIKYFMNHKEHHKTKYFDKNTDMLTRFGIVYKPKYLFVFM